MGNILLVVAIAVVAAACAPVQPTPVSVVGDTYDVASRTLVERYGFKLDLPRDRWPTLACDLNVDFSGNITWWRLCGADYVQNRTGVIAVATKLCYRPEVIEKKILDWYAGKYPYTILKKEVSESPAGHVVTHYTIRHGDHQDFLAMIHVSTPKASLVVVAATGKDKKGREEDFRRDFELVTKSVVISGAVVSGTPPASSQ